MKYIPAQDEPPLDNMGRTRKHRFGAAGYKKKYAKIAFDLLAHSKTAKTKAHVCRKLLITKATLLDWMGKYPEFKEAIETGLLYGEVKWRNQLAEYAFQPTYRVNNTLLKLLSYNVYGISEDPPALVINQAISDMSFEERLKARGIPIPDIKIEDINE